MANLQDHKQRAHSRFSASGAERWLACPASASISEGLPDKSSVYSLEGTAAHEVLEHMLLKAIATGAKTVSTIGASFDWKWQGPPNKEMISHTANAANFILRLHHDLPGSELLVETRVHLDFIHPEMFGTFDAAVVDHFGTLHVLDFKFGSGHAVSPVRNLQMAFYGVGLAHLYQWNFKRVRLWVVQPRIKGYDGPTYWETPTLELKTYVDTFKRGVERVESSPNEFKEGGHCHFCLAKGICPLKRGAKIGKARNIFLNAGAINGEKEKSGKEESRDKEEKAREAQAAREKEISNRIERAFGGNGSDADFY